MSLNMATSLQRQLAALATPSSALLIPDRKVSSILFTPQEAARHKREFFYDLGCDGLHELIKVNPVLFKKFLTSPLFNESSKRFERIVEDKEANEKLNALLEEFLISLSPYLMLKAVVKCLEWLVNRFHIEKFNVDLIMECIIPYFDTKTFALVIQILDVSTRSNPWQWILPNVKTALPLSKPDLYGQCNSQFLVWIFSTFYKYLDYHVTRPENLRVFLSFMTSIFSGVLNRINIDLQNTDNPKIHIKAENRGTSVISCLWSQLAKLSTYIKNEEQLKSNEEIQSMIYIVSTVVFNTVAVNPELRIVKGRSHVEKLMANILKSHPRSLKTQAYLLLNLLSSVGENKVIIKKKVQLRRALTEIGVLSSDWDLWHLSSKLILNHVLQNEFRFAISKLWNLLSAINFTIPQRSEVLKSLYLKLCSPETPKQFREWRKKFLTRFEREYPIEFELACNGDPKFSSSLAKVTRGKNFVLLAQHPSVEIRLEAVKNLVRTFEKKYFLPEDKALPSLKISKYGKKSSLKLKSKKSSNVLKPVVPDTNKTAKTLLPRFKDEASEIVHFLIKQDLKVLAKMFSTTTLVEQLNDIIERKECGQPCMKAAVFQLCQVAEKIQPDSELGKLLIPKIFATLVPLLFPTTSFKLKLCITVVTSEFAKKNFFLKGYSKLTLNENISAEEICDFSYDALTSSTEVAQLAKNWNPDSSTTNEVAAVFGILLWNSTNRFGDFLDWVEKVDFKPFSRSWCVTKSNFPKCLQQASKRRTVALELVLTTFSRLNVTNAADIERVVTFAFRNSEKLESRNICAGFLKAYLNKHYSNVSSQLRLWISIIINTSTKAVGLSSIWNEFLLIRVLQFLSFTLKECSTRKAKVDQKLNGRIVEVILTQCLDQDSSRLRLWGLNCLEDFAGLGNSLDSEFAQFMTEYRGEIIADKEQVPVIVTKALQMDEFTEIRDRFIKVIVEESVEEIIGTGLLKMFRFANFMIFTQFFPVANELLQSDPGSKKLLAILNCFDGSLSPRSFEILVEALKYKDSCLVMLSKMTPAVFESYEEHTKRKLIALLIDTVLFSKVPEIKVIIQRRVRKWVLDASIVSAELDKCIRLEKLLSSGANNATARKPSKRRASEAVSHSVFGDVEWTNRTEVVLEFVQNRKRLQQKSKLILPLFKLLKTCIALEEQSPVEYLKQLILTTLTLCCYEEDIRDKANMEDWKHFNVETVIDCLRCSRNPQTHHHALILLNYAARKYPEQVLHGVMSLFAFMGNSILRQDDSYSTQLIQQTVTTIIPTLANETSARQFSKNLVSAGIFRVFTSAVQDIPTHRRLPVFISLVETLGPKETMWQACIIIIDNALTRDKKRSHLNADMELATDIVWHFDANDVITSLAKVYEYLIDLPIFERNFTEEVFTRVKSNQEPHSKAIIDLSRKETLRDAEIIVLFTVELLSKICDKFVELEGRKELIYDSFLQKCLSMARVLASNQEDKIMRLIGLRNMEVIEKINAALNPTEFIRVTIAILLSDDNIVKKKMMDLLNQRILHQMEWFKYPTILLEVIPHLVKLGGSIPETEDQVTLVQTSLLSLKLIGRHLAALHPEEFVPVFELASGHTKHKNKLLRASGLLCLGELFSLKSLILPKLADVCSAILRAFKASTKLNSKALSSMLTEDSELDHEVETSVTTANLLCISAMTCLNKLVEQLGTFLGSSFLQKVLIVVFSIEEIFGHGSKSENRRKVFEQRLKTLLKTIGTKIPLRSSIITIKEVFVKLEEVEDYSSKSKSLLLLIGLLRETLAITPKADFTTLLPCLCDVFLEHLLTHRERIVENENAPAEKLDEVENSFLDCLVSGMVLKMSEGMFRPFYRKMFDWASDSLPRLITFFRLSTMAAERLRSLFVTFAGFVVHEGSKRLTEDAALTRAILSYFCQIFLHDKEGFVTIERFNALVKPLADLVESEFLRKGDISIKQLNDTLIQLAVASNDLNRWQHMIDLLSLKTRHEDPKVRLFVISTIEAAAAELGKDFLPLLPPAVPFLAEMMNDDDDDVEKETRKMLAKLEDLLGESLQPYFTV